MNPIRFKAATVLAGALIAVVPAVTIGGPASGAPGVGAGSGQRITATGLSAEELAAVQRDLGLNADQVKQRIAAQATAIEADHAMRGALGSAFAGSWFDPDLGKLVVAVTGTKAAAQAAPSGVQIRTVKHNSAHLFGIKAELDALAGKSTNNPAVRVSTGKRSPAVEGLTSWYVDAKTNSVVVTALAGQQPAAALTTLAKYGDAVRVQYTTRAAQTTAQFMDGGDAINGFSCSAGFNLRNHISGQGYLLTAGHCVSAGSALSGQDGVGFGPVLESWFDTYDDAIARNDNAGYWIQGPWVDTNPSGGSVVTMTGVSDAPTGTLICKSGITTRLTCGNITAKDVTVNLIGGFTVFGETQHSACVERGDSGGANYVLTASRTAEGVTSAAALDGAGLCLSKSGGTNISYYFPIADSLAYYGSVYGVSIW